MHHIIKIVIQFWKTLPVFRFDHNERRGYNKSKSCYVICKRSLKEMSHIEKASNRWLGLIGKTAQWQVSVNYNTSGDTVNRNLRRRYRRPRFN